MLLERTLLDFGYQVRVVQIDTGPVITQFEIELEAGLRVSKIMSLADDLAIALAVPSVRIVAPIPGKTTVGIEVPNDHRNMVRLGDVIAGVGGRSEKCRIPLFLGKDVKGAAAGLRPGRDAAPADGRPHRHGQVGLPERDDPLDPDDQAARRGQDDPDRPQEGRALAVQADPAPDAPGRHRHEEGRVAPGLGLRQDGRAVRVPRAGPRCGTSQAYNKLGAEEIYARLAPEDDEERKRIPTYMPYIVIVIDELAEMMMTAEKEVEQHIVRLAQLARAVGMHLILATQKPTVDVVTGLIKGNLPARIAFQVTNRSDSRVVLDEMGAERLLGNGDMLFLIPGTSHIIRAQGTYVSDVEVNRDLPVPRALPRRVQPRADAAPGRRRPRRQGPRRRAQGARRAVRAGHRGRHPRGPRLVLAARSARSGIGYGRAARLIDFMAEDGIVGEFKSGSAREVLYTWEEWEALKNGGDGQGRGGGVRKSGPCRIARGARGPLTYLARVL